MKNTGGKNAYLQVLHCSNMDFSMNFEEVHLLYKQFGKVDRIMLKLAENETSLDSYIVFTCSDLAADAHSKLDGHTANSFTLRTRSFDVCHLNDPLDYIPEDDTQDFGERKAPRPVCFVATYTRRPRKFCKSHGNPS